jgi:hypothetical protein
MQDELRFAIEMWSSSGLLERVIARAAHLGIARVAFEATIAEYPCARITLSEGTKIIDGIGRRELESRFKNEAGRRPAAGE